MILKFVKDLSLEKSYFIYKTQISLILSLVLISVFFVFPEVN